jgi:hypothetical protein
MARPRTGSILLRDGVYFARVTATVAGKSQRFLFCLNTSDAGTAEARRTTLIADVAAGRVRFPADEAHARRLLPPAIAPWPSDPGVYFVLAGDRIKIGKAARVGQRLRELQTGSPQKLVLVAVAPGGLAEEAELHERFAAHRIQGEWFYLCPAVAEYAAKLRAGAP